VLPEIAVPEACKASPSHTPPPSPDAVLLLTVTLVRVTGPRAEKIPPPFPWSVGLDEAVLP
jgi:hypothetical protein